MEQGEGQEGGGGALPDLASTLTENPVALGGAAVGLIVAAILAALSLSPVPPLSYGIRYNYFNKYADTVNVYTAGRYFIGPWNRFLLFPATVRSVEFTGEPQLRESGIRYPALHTRTKEGLALHMQVSLQYRLSQKLVGKLYEEFNQDYEDMFISTIRDTLIKAAANYEATQLWKMREAVGENMQSMVNDALARTYAECWGLQLMVIELPRAFERSIVSTQVQQQNVTTMEYAQTATRIHAETKVIEAEYERKVKVIKAHGKANYTLTTKVARAHARGRVLDVEAEVMGGLKVGLKLLPDTLVEYQELSAVQMMENASVFFGFDESTQVFMQSPTRALSAAPAEAMPEEDAGAGRALHADAGADPGGVAGSRIWHPEL